MQIKWNCPLAYSLSIVSIVCLLNGLSGGSADASPSAAPQAISASGSNSEVSGAPATPAESKPATKQTAGTSAKPAARCKPAPIQVSPRAQVLVKKGVSFSKTGDYHNAIANFNQAINLDPLSFDAWFNRGWAYRQMGDFDHAITDYSSAIKLQPRKAQVYLNRGWCHSRLNHDGEAMKDFDKALEIDPAYVNVYRNRGSLRLKMGDYQGALDDFNQVLTLDPNSKNEVGKYLQANLGNDPAARALLDSPDAKKALNRVSDGLKGTNFRVSDRDMARLNNKAARAIKEGNFERAIEILQGLAKANPNYKFAKVNLATAYNNQGLKLAKEKPEESAKLFRHALYFAPREAAARANLDAMLKEQGIDPQCADARIKLGDKLSAKGDFQGAYIEYLEAQRLNSNADVKKKLDEIAVRLNRTNAPSEEGEVSTSAQMMPMVSGTSVENKVSRVTLVSNQSGAARSQNPLYSGVTPVNAVFNRDSAGDAITAVPAVETRYDSSSLIAQAPGNTVSDSGGAAPDRNDAALERIDAAAGRNEAPPERIDAAAGRADASPERIDAAAGRADAVAPEGGTSSGSEAHSSFIPHATVFSSLSVERGSGKAAPGGPRLEGAQSDSAPLPGAAGISQTPREAIEGSHEDQQSASGNASMPPDNTESGVSLKSAGNSDASTSDGSGITSGADSEDGSRKAAGIDNPSSNGIASGASGSAKTKQATTGPLDDLDVGNLVEAPASPAVRRGRRNEVSRKDMPVDEGKPTAIVQVPKIQPVGQDRDTLLLEWKIKIIAGDKFFDQGNYVDADNEYRQSITIARKLGDKSAELANSLEHMSRIYLAQKRPMEALSILEQCYALRREILEADNPLLKRTGEKVLYLRQALYPSKKIAKDKEAEDDDDSADEKAEAAAKADEGPVNSMEQSRRRFQRDFDASMH